MNQDSSPETSANNLLFLPGTIESSLQDHLDNPRTGQELIRRLAREDPGAGLSLIAKAKAARQEGVAADAAFIDGFTVGLNARLKGHSSTFYKDIEPLYSHSNERSIVSLIPGREASQELIESSKVKYCKLIRFGAALLFLTRAKLSASTEKEI